MLTIAETIIAVCLLCLAGLCGYALGRAEKMYREDDVRPVVKGRNIFDTVDGHCEFKCSVCGVELSSVYGGDNDFGLDGGYFNFCPNCGASMVNENE